MAQLSSIESSKPLSPQKTRLLGELEDTKRSLTHKEEEMWQLIERMQSLEDTRERDNLEKARGSLEEPQEITCAIEVKKKKKNGECIIMKLGTIININQRIYFLL